MDYIEAGTKKYWKASSALFAGGFITFAILYSTQPLLPVFSQRFHVSPEYSSLALSSTTGVLSFALLIAAVVSDRFGRKNIMTCSLVLSSAAAIGTAFSPNFLSLLVLRTMQGVVLAGMPSIAMAYVSEEFHERSLGAAMGLYVSGTTVGGMFGRIVVGMVSDFFSWRAALICVGLISFLFSLWFWAGLPEPEHFKIKNGSFSGIFQPFARHLKTLRLVCLFGIGFLLMGGFVTLFNYMGFLLMRPPFNLTQTEVGWMFAVYVFGTFSSTWMGKLADTKGKGLVLLIGMSIMMIGVLCTLVPSLMIKIIGVALYVFGFFGSHSIASGWVGSIALHDRAQAASLYLFFYYAGSSILGTFGGVLWQYSRWPGVVTMIVLCIFLAFGLETLLLRSGNHSR
ncbi:MFS transporter [Sporolactobacillus putidus]|uniref:MFS-type transporter YybF n=1 Tax=Sporolactobacillus putidus TaxID=492735 RepID=A0A917S9P2_9BACL|nr:MFS transporter [Sporolactobacillus putidus]GGL65500.1 putative MFS-type transporter YybF [Sporolactobacillus putidus]